MPGGKDRNVAMNVRMLIAIDNLLLNWQQPEL